MIAELFASMIPAARNVSRYVNASLENPRFSLDDPAAYEALTGGYRSASGVVVTHENAATIAAVNQALNLLSGDVAKLPLYPYKRLDDDDREIYDTHRAYYAVSIKANPYKSAKRFWRDITIHRLLWGNGYGYITSGPRGVELYNLLPDRTTWETHGGREVYVTEVAGKIVPLDPSQVLHIRGISLDGHLGLDLTKCARDAWGLALAAQNFESKFFKNGARKGGILELPAGMSKPARDTIEEGFRKTYEEGDNPFKTVIVREGAKFHDGQVTPQQGQVTELHAERRRDVAAFFNIPPSKLGIPGSVSYNSYEQESLAYLHGCLHHLLDDAADECDQKLLTEQERREDTAYFEHNVSKFTQADWGTQVTKLVELRNAEIVSPNEVRKKLNMVKRTDPGGDEYINPNTKSAQSPGEPNAINPTDDLKARMDAYGVGVRAGAFTPQTDDEDHFRQESGLPAMSAQAKAAWKEEDGVRHPITLRDPNAPAGGGFGGGGGGGGGGEDKNAENRRKETHRQLFVDAFGRMARRVAFDARTASKDSKKFTTWIDSEAAKHKSVFGEHVAPVSAAYASVFGGDGAALTAKAESAFFTEVMGLSAFLEAPHAAVDLQTNVGTYLDTFERTAPERVAASIMEIANV